MTKGDLDKQKCAFEHELQTLAECPMHNVINDLESLPRYDEYGFSYIYGDYVCWEDVAELIKKLKGE